MGSRTDAGDLVSIDLCRSQRVPYGTCGRAPKRVHIPFHMARRGKELRSLGPTDTDTIAGKIEDHRLCDR